MRRRHYFQYTSKVTDTSLPSVDLGTVLIEIDESTDQNFPVCTHEAGEMQSEPGATRHKTTFYKGQ